MINFAQNKRELVLFGGLGMILAVVFSQMGSAFSLRMLMEAACYAIIALGLTIQWGYAGLFNVGIMGFIAVGGFLTVLVSFPVNDKFWNSDAPSELGVVILYLLAGIAITWSISKLHRFGLPKKTGDILDNCLFCNLLSFNRLGP